MDAEEKASVSPSEAIMALIDKMGGLQALANKLKEAGLTDVASSWIRQGPNKPISEEKVKEVFGESAMAKIADELGVNRQEAVARVASLLPAIIDKMTPNGKLPLPGIFVYLINLLKSLFGSKKAS